MKRHPLVLSGFLLSALMYLGTGVTARAAEDGTYVLAKKNFVPPTGTKLSKEVSSDFKEAAMKINAAGQSIDGTMTRTESCTETREVVSPEKIRLVTESREVVGKMNIAGQEQPTPEQPDPLLKKAILLELKEGKWTAGLEGGGEPSETQKAGLEKLAVAANTDSDYHMYGDTPRKVGDEWPVDPSKTGFGDGAALAGTYSVKFVEVKDVDGVKCAVLKSVYDLVGKVETGNDEGLGMQMKGEAVATRSLADLTDLNVEINATMTLEGSPEEGVAMNIKGPMKGVQKIAVKKP